MTANTTPIEPGAASPEGIRKLISPVRYVLWDLDGPMCQLFAGHPAGKVAHELVASIEEGRQPELLTMEERLLKDPHAMLVGISRRHPGSRQVAKWEDWLTEQELLAVRRALPTPHASDLIKAWSDQGARFALVTNNSARAATAYLSSQGVASHFPHVYGRTRDLSLMKPHPHSLLQALNAMRAAPFETLMLGDAPTDYAAAQAADVRFMGYADDALKADALRQAGVEASCIVRSLKEVCDALTYQP
ncbi:HAD-IA family hydrolase (plasmid) [Streptomyces sp. Qhu-G9]|uniref:HAD family hydrolase n=1 Tax=Streptomyces sp. Qhu-G9 TaxID=3452799 RepID=UPI0022AC2832|nr:HAD-IA family hydrolase [Streptomyces aurantiacus]WAU78369.1 HAD-IA family hydrolase [Streptomyces aurantiacus]